MQSLGMNAVGGYQGSLIQQITTVSPHHNQIQMTPIPVNQKFSNSAVTGNYDGTFELI